MRVAVGVFVLVHEGVGIGVVLLVGDGDGVDVLVGDGVSVQVGDGDGVRVWDWVNVGEGGSVGVAVRVGTAAMVGIAEGDGPSVSAGARVPEAEPGGGALGRVGAAGIALAGSAGEDPPLSRDTGVGRGIWPSPSMPPAISGTEPGVEADTYFARSA